MEDQLLDQFNSDFALFIETGFIAVKQLDEISAMRLFEAAHLLDPKSAAPTIGMGYISLNKLEIGKATEIFLEILEDEPDHQLAQTFLAICYLLKKDRRKEGEALINKIQKEADDPTIVNLCKVSLDWSAKDLRGAKAPFFQMEENSEM